MLKMHILWPNFHKTSTFLLLKGLHGKLIGGGGGARAPCDPYPMPM